MNYQIIGANTFKTNRWSGGTTTELFIYPPAAHYTARNFDCRISTATVEAEESTFTALPGYTRKLMVLDGETTLSHENQHKKSLTKFAVDEFDGAWKTISRGSCTDFNVMTRAPFKSELKGFGAKAGTEITINTKQGSRWLFVYVQVGAIVFNGLGPKSEVSQGDFLILENQTDITLFISAKTKSEVVVVEIFL